MNAAMLTRPVSFLVMALTIGTSSAYAQAKPQPKPRPAPAARQSRHFEVGGYALVGRVTFAATESFDAILGDTAAPVVGGGARLGLPWYGLFIDAGAWRFQGDGERVLVANNVVHRLNIPVEITLTPFEISAGWRLRIRRLPRLTPYAAGGLTAMKYVERSDFSTPAEDVDETFNGYHLFGGAEYRILGWLGAAGEVAWTRVPDSIGEGGVSMAFDESDLGGTSFRIKVTIGR